MTYLTIKFWQFVKYLIRKDYGYLSNKKGERCDDCASCRASYVQDFIDEHIKLIKWK